MTPSVTSTNKEPLPLGKKVESLSNKATLHGRKFQPRSRSSQEVELFNQRKFERQLHKEQSKSSSLEVERKSEEVEIKNITQRKQKEATQKLSKTREEIKQLQGQGICQDSQKYILMKFIAEELKHLKEQFYIATPDDSEALDEFNSELKDYSLRLTELIAHFENCLTDLNKLPVEEKEPIWQKLTDIYGELNRSEEKRDLWLNNGIKGEDKPNLLQLKEQLTNNLEIVQKSLLEVPAENSSKNQDQIDAELVWLITHLEARLQNFAYLENQIKKTV
jgi:hypothetical protein